jgi:hypothetical protein
MLVRYFMAHVQDIAEEEDVADIDQGCEEEEEVGAGEGEGEEGEIEGEAEDDEGEGDGAYEMHFGVG